MSDLPGPLQADVVTDAQALYRALAAVYEGKNIEYTAALMAVEIFYGSVLLSIEEESGVELAEKSFEAVRFFLAGARAEMEKLKGAPMRPTLIDPQLMTDSEFNDALDVATKGVRDMLVANPHENFVPMMHLCALTFDEKTGDVTPGTIVALLADLQMERRYESLFAFGHKMGESLNIIRAVFFMSEAWVSRAPQQGPRPYKIPADDPKRQEVIVVAGLTIDKRGSMARIAITRDPENDMVPGKIETIHYVKGGEWAVQGDLLGSFYGGYQKGLFASLPPMYRQR